MQMIQKIKKNIEDITIKLTGSYYWINGEYMDRFLKEVEKDVFYLKLGMNIYKYERDEDIVFQNLIKKYQKDYCPSTFYKYFSFENELKYLCLRGEIDKIIDQKDDFLLNNPN